MAFSGKNEEASIFALLKPILEEKKLMNVPKLVICQFCRGTDMDSTASDSDLNLKQDLSNQVVNRQEIIENFLDSSL